MILRYVLIASLLLFTVRGYQPELGDILEVLVNTNQSEEFEGSSLLCYFKLYQLYNGFKSGDVESLYFVDALGKPSSGVLTGNLVFLGDYDLCQSIKTSSKGYYLPCMSTATYHMTGNPYPLPLTWTTCLPEECQSDAFTSVFNTTVIPVLANHSVNITGFNTQCETPVVYDAGAYIALVVIALILLLTLIGTVWDPLVVLFSSFAPPSELATLLIDGVGINDQIDDELLDAFDDHSPVDGIENANSLPSAPTFILNNLKKCCTMDAIGQFFKCFSLQRTLPALLATGSKPGQVLCLNGIRVLSINWVVLGHLYYIPYIFGIIGDPSYGTTLVNRESFQLVMNAGPSVDTFFLLSGFLVSYLLLKDITQRHRFAPIGYYLHRYIRLTVPYIMVILIEGFLYPVLVKGPFQYLLKFGHDTCKQYMWTNMLYLNNFIPWSERKMCIGQSWYLANDFQFYLLAPIFVIVLHRRPRIGNCILWGTLGSSVIIAGISYWAFDFNLASGADNPYFLYQYIKPWIRFPPYLVGVFGGWLYWKHSLEIHAFGRKPVWKKLFWGVVIWFPTILVQWSILWGRYKDTGKHPERETQGKNISYEMFARVAWAISLLVQILACQAGLGGWINSALSWKCLIPLARLTYSVYLLHIGLIMVLIVQLRHPWFIKTDYEVAILYTGILVFTYTVAVLIHVLVEQPVGFLERLSYRKPKRDN